MIPSILWLLSLASLGWALFMFVGKPVFGLSFIRTPLRSLAYFLALAVLIGLWFIDDAARLLSAAPWHAYAFALVVLVGLAPWLYRFSRQSHVSSIRTVFRHAHLELLDLDDRFLLGKLGDVLFQQMVAGILILQLAAAGLSLPAASAAFALIFALGHIGLLLRIPHRWAAYFLLSALLGGALLPLVYQNLPGAFYYAVSLHMLWYVMTGAFHAHAEAKESHQRG